MSWQILVPKHTSLDCINRIVLVLSLCKKLLKGMIYSKIVNLWYFARIFYTIMNLWVKLILLESSHLGFKTNTNLTQFRFEMSEIWPFEVDITTLSPRFCTTLARLKLPQIVNWLWTLKVWRHNLMISYMKQTLVAQLRAERLSF